MSPPDGVDGVTVLRGNHEPITLEATALKLCRMRTTTSGNGAAVMQSSSHSPESAWSASNIYLIWQFAAATCSCMRGCGPGFLLGSRPSKT